MEQLLTDTWLTAPIGGTILLSLVVIMINALKKDSLAAEYWVSLIGIAANIALAVVVFGVVGYQRLSIELFPDISHPSITVQTDFPDTAPQEVETLVTRPVEEAVGVLRGLKTVRSVSRPGVSEVTLEFDWGSDMDVLSMEVREKLEALELRPAGVRIR